MNSKLLEDMDHKEYRDSLVDAYVRDGIAFQLRCMRMARKWDQKALARRMGNEKLQSLISRYENPDYGRFSVTTLLELARTFDVGLVVRFAEWGEIVNRDENFTREALNVSDYTEYKKRRVLPMPKAMTQEKAKDSHESLLDSTLQRSQYTGMSDDYEQGSSRGGGINAAFSSITS